jgi:RNA polymerase sigma factor (sigma-70 family)
MNQNSEPLVLGIAKQYEGRNGLSLDELVTAGNIGLTEAIKRFDPDRGEPLSAPARRWIKRSIKKALSLGRVPTAKEIGALYPKHSQLPPTSSVSSLNPASFDDDTRNAFGCILAEAGLDGREQEIILLRYGVADGVLKTHKQIGERLNLTRARIGQIEKAAREKLEML